FDQMLPRLRSYSCVHRIPVPNRCQVVLPLQLWLKGNRRVFPNSYVLNGSARVATGPPLKQLGPPVRQNREKLRGTANRWRSTLLQLKSQPQSVGVARNQ